MAGTIEVKDWQDFARAVEPFAPAGAAGEGMLFRGQPDAGWKLVPRIARDLPSTLTTDNLVHIESALTAAFEARAHTFLPPALALMGGNDAETWAVMQHYGAPTRLLDWTASPYVAAYFAVRDLSERRQPGAVWYYNISAAHEGGQRRWGPNSLALADLRNHPASLAAVRKPGVLVVDLRRAMDRMSSQLGKFTVAGDPREDHWSLIEQAHVATTLPKIADDYGCIVINGDLKPLFLRQLHSANVQAAALFPGLDGIGRFIYDSLHMSARERRFGGQL
jgi:hypothetical protein